MSKKATGISAEMVVRMLVAMVLALGMLTCLIPLSASAAALMSVRSFDKMNDIKSSKPTVLAAQTETAAGSVVGKWSTGNISGGLYNSVSGRYERAAGLGEIYGFNADGTYYEMIVYNTLSTTYVISITGKYAVKDGVIKFTNRVSESSSDNGKTWSAKKAQPDESRYFTFGSDSLGDYLLVGLTDAQLPLDPSTNAVKYRPVL